MYQTEIKNPIYLVRYDEVIIYSFVNYDQLVDYWPWIKHLSIGPGPSFKYTPPDVGRLLECYCEQCRLTRGVTPPMIYTYIIRDSLGNCYNPGIVGEDSWKKIRERRKYRWGYPNPRQPGSRTGQGWGHMYRRPKTTQERRWAHAWDDEDFAPKVRKARNKKNLVDAWDDRRLSSREDRNWKRFRKTQWK